MRPIGPGDCWDMNFLNKPFFRCPDQLHLVVDVVDTSENLLPNPHNKSHSLGQLSTSQTKTQTQTRIKKTRKDFRVFYLHI